MASRKLETLTLGTATARIYKDADLGEFIVKFDKNGRHLVRADYFTSDKADAYGTALVELRRMRGPEIAQGVLVDGKAITYIEGHEEHTFHTEHGRASCLRAIAKLNAQTAKGVTHETAKALLLERARMAVLAAACLEAQG